jgi:ribose transport system ATP-binding protein
MAQNNEMIRFQNISKVYGGVTALKDVSFSIRSGEIHAVVGENGAGKSTTMKLLAGIESPSSGDIFIDDQKIQISSPRDAEKLGVSMVFQEMNLFDTLSVAANIFINSELKIGHSFLNDKQMCKQADEVLGSLMVDIKPTDTVRCLSTGQKQIVEIARAIHRGTKIVIMDEPNSALNNKETEVLFEIIRNLKECGITVLYVSHRLEEVFTICDRISVLRDGQYMGTWEKNKVSVEQIVTKMVGRDLGDVFPNKSTGSIKDKITLEVKKIQIGDKNSEKISFNARKGEILGFAGLEGSGVQEVFKKVFGLVESKESEIIYNGKKIEKTTPENLIQKGWAFIPADRREEGLMLDWSILKNISIVIIQKLLTRIGLINHRLDKKLSRKYIEQLKIATESEGKKVANLSGGNQQKVVLAKWLATDPNLMILNDPTRGIDVGTKQEIYRMIKHWSEEGYTVIFTSSEIEEIVGLCHRILVMYKGKIIKEFADTNPSKEQIMKYVLGGANI